MEEPAVRTLKTAEGIRAEIQAMLDGTRLAGPCNVRCIPTPVRLDNADATGCNWTVTTLLPTCPPPCVAMIDGFVARAKELYNLK